MVDYQHRLLCDKKSWAFVAGVDAAGVDAAGADADANKLARRGEDGIVEMAMDAAEA